MNIKKKEFFEIYHKNGLILKQCPHCRRFIETMCDTGKFARVYCPSGCGCATVVNSKQMTDEQMIVKVVEKWNKGEWDR